MQFLWVGLAGAAGSLVRYLVGLAMPGTHMPWATLIVNLTGAFAIGFVFTWGLARLPTEVTTPIAVGLLGGFTTFSAFAWEGLVLAGAGRAGQAAAYMLASVIGGLMAALLGRLVGAVLL